MTHVHLLFFVLLFALVCPPAHAQDITSNLVAHWMLDGDVTDTLTTHDGTNNGNVPFVGGVLGMAAKFNGTDQYVQVTNYNSGTASLPYTVSMWFRFENDLSASATLMFGGRAGACQSSPGIFIGADESINVGTSHGCGTDDNEKATAAATVAPGQWYHLAVIADNTGWELFLDGSSIESSNIEPSTLMGAGACLFIGAGQVGNCSAPNNYFPGKIDDVRIYHRALTVEDIWELYTEHICPFPRGFRGEITYNRTSKTLRGCNGDKWVEMGAVSRFGGLRRVGEGDQTNAMGEQLVFRGDRLIPKRVCSFTFYDISADPAAPVRQGLLNGTANCGDINSAGGIAVTNDGNTAYVNAGNFTGLKVINLTDPANITEHIADYTDSGNITNVDDSVVSADGNTLFVIGNHNSGAVGDEIMSIDISDPANPSFVDAVNIPDGVVRRNIRLSDDGNYVYTVGRDNGNWFHVINVSDPANLSVAGGVNGPAEVNIGGMAVNGNFVYVASNEDPTLTVIDVSNPAAPTVRGSVTDAATLEVRDDNVDMAVVDGRYVIVPVGDNDLLTYVDVRDPDDPKIVGSLALASPRATALYGGLVYVIENANTIGVYEPILPQNLTNGLIGHWKLDEASGDPVDSSGANVAATQTGLTWQPGGGVLGGAADFEDSASDRIEPGTAFAANPEEITIATWVNVPSWPGYNPRITDRLAGQLFIIGSNARLQFSANRWLSNNGRWDTAADIITFGQWHHVAVTYSFSATTNDPKIYVDGVEVSVTENDAPLGGLGDDSGNTFYIGNRNTHNRSVRGQMDDFRVYDRILSDTEIAALHEMGAPVTLENGLVGHWMFDENSGGVITDSGSGGVTTTWEDGDNDDVTEESINGVLGVGLSFNGTSTRVTMPVGALQITGDLTLAGWLKPNGTGLDLHYAVTWDSGTTTPYGFRFDEAGVEGYLCLLNTTSGGPVVTEWLSAVENQWYHIACVFDSTAQTYTLYVDGVERASESSTGNTINYTAFGDQRLYIGYDPQHGYFTGDADDIRVYDRPLSAAEVADLYDRGMPQVVCSVPDGVEGEITYNTAHRVFQLCTPGVWVALHRPGSGGGGCSFPSGVPGEITFNTTYKTFQGCTPDGWFAFHPQPD